MNQNRAGNTGGGFSLYRPMIQAAAGLTLRQVCANASTFSCPEPVRFVIFPQKSSPQSTAPSSVTAAMAGLRAENAS